MKGWEVGLVLDGGVLPSDRPILLLKSTIDA